MTYPYTRPPARTVRPAISAADKNFHVAPRELPKKLPIWQVVTIWLAVVMLLPFVIFLLGALSSLIGIEQILPPEAFYTMAQFSLLLALFFSSVVGIGFGLLYLLIHRPHGQYVQLTLLLLGLLAVLLLIATYALVNF